MSKRKKRSEKLIAELKRMRYFQKGIRRCNYQLKNKIFEETQNEHPDRELVTQMTKCQWDQVSNSDKIFARLIGEAIVNEI